MKPVSHKTAQKLIARYLRVDKGWDGARDARMRSHLRECDACAAQYDRAVTLHRHLVGGDPLMPTAFERGRMMDATIQLSAGLRPIPTPGPRFAVWGALAGLAAAALLVFTVGTDPGRLGFESPEETYVGARGSGFYALSVGIGLSGVTRSQREYEIVADGTRAYLDDWMRISTTRVVDDYPYVFIFGMQEGREPVWYYPDPEHEAGRSQRVPLGTAVPLGAPEDAFEYKLDERHVEGHLSVVAIFTTTPLGLDTVKNALDGRRSPISIDSEIAFGHLGFEEASVADGAIVRILEVEIVPGSREDTDVP